ncbi:pyrimidodiazepine synthase-like [Mercenaria mercenaria]|uniref:pyrimidodiazepine synthase-like n=1 Tax=Mercenaria mercenaria TaxID=6596 RepID=UPI001E1D82EB|nr:pyrimidodiazepine synthase-like [Mercenaria mercenaria]
MSSEQALWSESEYPKLQPGVLRLYSNRFCPFAKRTRLLLEHKNIPHEIVNINLADKPKWYTEKVSCLGMVPAIQCGDVIIFDSIIVNEYLDSVFQDNRLVPEDPYKVAKDKMLAEIWAKVLRQCGKMFTCHSGNESEVIPDLLAELDHIDEELKIRNAPFFGGDKPMMIDFHIWPHMERIVHYSQLYEECKLDNGRFRHLTPWIGRMMSLPVVIKTKTPLEWFRLFIESVKAGKTDCDIGLAE